MPFEKRISLLGLAVLVSWMLGCVTAGVDTMDYSPPQEPQDIDNEVIVEADFLQVWDLLIRELSKSYFVINNVEKASRLINLSFHTTEPEEFVDCGSTKRTHSFLGDTEVYEYQTASASKFKLAGDILPNASAAWEIEVFRKPSLEGRINVYVAPVESGTEITVNTRYILETKADQFSRLLNAQRAVLGSDSGSVEPFTISFNTNTRGSVKWDGDPQGRSTICYATGVMEDSILDLVRADQNPYWVPN